MRMKRNAVALILGLIAIVALSGFSAVILSRSVSEVNLARRHAESSQAFWLAEAGLHRGLWELNHGDGNWTGWTISGSDRTKTGTLASGQYSVTITDAGNATASISASGHIPDISSSRIEREIGVDLSGQTSSPFSYAGFGKTSVTMSGNGETDSYDSSQGAYGAGNKGSNGDIGTNGINSGAISLSGNAEINGDANTGPGGTVDLSGNAEVNGTTDDTCAEDYPSVTVPSSLTSLASSGSYSVGGNNNQTLSSGDYKFTDISISGNADLTLTGTINIYLTETSGNAFQTTGNGKIIVAAGAQITIYTDGKCNIAGNGVVNNTNLPENFLLYSTYSGSSDGVKIAGNGDLYAGIYAPDTQVKVTGNGDNFGSIISDELIVTGNGDIHYDEALQNVGAGTITSYSIETWTDSDSPYPLSS